MSIDDFARYSEVLHRLTADFVRADALANVNSQNLSGYSIDQTTGALTPLPGSPFTTGTGPTKIVIR